MKRILIQMPARSEPGKPGIVKDDKIKLVDDDGIVLGDLAETVTSWRVRSDIGNVRVLELRIIRFELVELEE